ncbi:replication protein A 32 kDa subunit B-like [Triticum urartu]|uniref:replication protein A 32 kDa subunit B-like n=1 Tax=Triticum urartu TaxID=4572 RepID=UPI002043688B|nr:replication protein A 32 kDa subunit B-like [Triticum urartu]
MVKGKTETGAWPRSQSAVMDAFAGAIVAAVEDRYHESVAPVHYIGRQYLDPPNNLVPLTLKQVSMLTPSARHGGHYRCTGCLSARLKTNFMPVEDEHNLIDCCTFRTIDGEYMQALREVRNGDYVMVNGSIRRRDSVMHIRVYSIRLVTNYNEITHHFLHCIYVSLDLQKQAGSIKFCTARSEQKSMPPFFSMLTSILYFFS